MMNTISKTNIKTPVYFKSNKTDNAPIKYIKSCLVQQKSKIKSGHYEKLCNKVHVIAKTFGVILGIPLLLIGQTIKAPVKLIKTIARKA